MPLTVNELLSVSAATFLILIYSNKTLAFIFNNDTYFYSVYSTNILASISIMQTFFNLFFMLIVGMAGATNIIIGKKLGSNLLDEAKDDANKLLGLAFVLSCISALLFALSIYIIPIFYSVSYEVLRYSSNLILINAVFFPFIFLNTVVFFILRVGGDMKNVFILNSLFPWVVTIPCALILRYYFNLSFIFVFIFSQSFFVVKLFLSSYFFNKGHWLKNLTN
jgi:Na+-driven multidrug efflux pump